MSRNMLPRLFDDDVFGVFDPFADFERGQDRVFGKRSAQLMRTDIRETDKAFKLSIDLPGFKKEDVSAELKVLIFPPTYETLRSWRINQAVRA